MRLDQKTSESLAMCVPLYRPNDTTPTLVLYGEHETSIISRHAPTLSAQIPDSTVREVPDAGHASPWDNPEFFNSTVRTFLASRTPIGAE